MERDIGYGVNKQCNSLVSATETGIHLSDLQKEVDGITELPLYSVFGIGDYNPRRLIAVSNGLTFPVWISKEEQSKIGLPNSDSLIPHVNTPIYDVSEGFGLQIAELNSLIDTSHHILRQSALDIRSRQEALMMNDPRADGWLGIASFYGKLNAVSERVLLRAAKFGTGEEQITAQNLLILHNTKAILRVVCQNVWKGDFEKSDLFQEGVIGFLKAIDTCDVLAENRFLTFAQWRILKEIQNANTYRGHPIPIPIKLMEKVIQFRALRMQDPDMTTAQIAKELRVKEKKISVIQGVAQMYFSDTDMKEEAIDGMKRHDHHSPTEEIALGRTIHDQMCRHIADRFLTYPKHLQNVLSEMMKGKRKVLRPEEIALLRQDQELRKLYQDSIAS